MPVEHSVLRDFNKLTTYLEKYHSKEKINCEVKGGKFLFKKINVKENNNIAGESANGVMESRKAFCLYLKKQINLDVHKNVIDGLLLGIESRCHGGFLVKKEMLMLMNKAVFLQSMEILEEDMHKISHGCLSDKDVDCIKKNISFNLSENFKCIRHDVYISCFLKGVNEFVWDKSIDNINKFIESKCKQIYRVLNFSCAQKKWLVSAVTAEIMGSIECGKMFDDRKINCYTRKKFEELVDFFNHINKLNEIKNIVSFVKNNTTFVDSSLIIFIANKFIVDHLLTIKKYFSFVDNDESCNILKKSELNNESKHKIKEYGLMPAFRSVVGDFFVYFSEPFRVFRYNRGNDVAFVCFLKNSLGDVYSRVFIKGDDGIFWRLYVEYMSVSEFDEFFPGIFSVGEKLFLPVEIQHKLSILSRVMTPCFLEGKEIVIHGEGRREYFNQKSSIANRLITHCTIDTDVTVLKKKIRFFDGLPVLNYIDSSKVLNNGENSENYSITCKGSFLMPANAGSEKKDCMIYLFEFMSGRLMRNERSDLSGVCFVIACEVKTNECSLMVIENMSARLNEFAMRNHLFDSRRTIDLRYFGLKLLQEARDLIQKRRLAFALDVVSDPQMQGKGLPYDLINVIKEFWPDDL